VARRRRLANIFESIPSPLVFLVRGLGNRRPDGSCTMPTTERGYTSTSAALADPSLQPWQWATLSASGGWRATRACPAPHVFLDATNDMSIAQDELFGPVVSIIRVRGQDEALKVANATSYSLSSAVPKKGGSHVNGRCQAGTSLN
jgi:hypothetical protein